MPIGERLRERERERKKMYSSRILRVEKNFINVHVHVYVYILFYYLTGIQREYTHRHTKRVTCEGLLVKTLVTLSYH